MPALRLGMPPGAAFYRNIQPPLFLTDLMEEQQSPDRQDFDWPRG